MTFWKWKLSPCLWSWGKSLHRGLEVLTKLVLHSHENRVHVSFGGIEFAYSLPRADQFLGQDYTHILLPLFGSILYRPLHLFLFSLNIWRTEAQPIVTGCYGFGRKKKVIGWSVFSKKRIVQVLWRETKENKQQCNNTQLLCFSRPLGKHHEHKSKTTIKKRKGLPLLCALWDTAYPQSFYTGSATLHQRHSLIQSGEVLGGWNSSY